MRVLYFTAAPIHDEGNGGRICQRNTIRRLTEDSGIELSVIAGGRPPWREGTEAFLESLGVPYEFVPFHDDNVHHSANSLRAIATYVVQVLFQFHWEVQSLNQGHVEAAVESGIRRWESDLLLIDFFSSALFIDLPRSDVRTAMIKLNREAEFYAGLLERDEWLHGSLTRWVSVKRLARFERRIDAAVDKVIVIARPDLPTHKTRSEPVCITPYLDRKPEPWRFTDSRSAFFVGSIDHFPNRRAMEWMTQALAPRLGARRDDARIVIVGADEDSVPADWRRPNVEFRGEADGGVVADLFRSTDISLCPIDNDLGLKFKAAEALSFGTPLLASEATLRAFPYLSGMPRLTMGDPDQAADEVARLLGNREALTRQSEMELEQQEAFAATQHDIWSRTLRDVPGPS
jgi:glycosyltransferase involved in cell wall biosynthesis